MQTQPWVVMAIAAAVCLAAAPAPAQTPAKGQSPASTQSNVRRLEVGGHFSTLQIGDAGHTNAGLGGRVSYEFLPWLALEGDVSYFPHDRLDIDLGASSLMLQTQYSRRRLEGFAGPKIGVRGERFGVFGKARPGVTHLIDKGMNCVGELCALALLARPEYNPEFALDLGGIVEFYATERTVARFDLGTTVIRHRSSFAPPCRECTTQNFSTSLGMGVKF
jgi:hypothetical protein